MKKLIICLLIVIAGFICRQKVYADYVLPYPSFMPGNKLYQASKIIDILKRYWYWGNIGQFTYRLQLADKYLVEAKTLFEYKQYLLGYGVLQSSNDNFKSLPGLASQIASQGKDNRKYLSVMHEAARAHIAVLTGMKLAVPDIFNWQPEKANSQMLKIGNLINESVLIRENSLNK